MKVALLLALLVAVPGARAASGRHVGKEELERMLHRYRDFSRLQVAFHETKTIQDIKVDIKSEGTLTIERPDRVIWAVAKPRPVTVRLDSHTIRIETGEGDAKKTEEVAVDQAGERASRGLRQMVAWFRLDVAQLLAQYEVSDQGGKKLEFVPRDAAGSPFVSLLMTLGKHESLERLFIREKSGDTIAIDFDKPEIRRGP